MAWPTDAQVNAGLAALLKVDAAQLPSLYAEVVTESNLAAQADLNRILSLAGYSAGQIASWDDQLSFGRDLALYWCAVKTGGLADYSDKFVKALDRREELSKSFAILINGVPTAPDGTSQVGGISNGRNTAVDDMLRHGHRNCGWW